jgi:hypothetical protein
MAIVEKCRLLSITYVTVKDKKGASIPVTGLEGRRFVRRPGSHTFSLNNRLTDGCEVVTASRAGRSLHPRKIPGTDFC